jgi:hypothetical protein
LDTLAKGYLKARKKAGQQEPRQAIEPLRALADAAERVNKAFAWVQETQRTNGIIRQVLSAPWDTAEDCVDLITALGRRAGDAAEQLNSAMGRSRWANDPRYAWAIEVFGLYATYVSRGALGTRETEGPFARFLAAAGESLGIHLPWATVHDRINGMRAPSGRFFQTKVKGGT